jgi:hypothetical protein
MTKKLMDPNDPHLKEGQRIAQLMELEMRKHMPEVETRMFAIAALAAVNSVMLSVDAAQANEVLDAIVDTARSAIPSVMAAKNTGKFDLQ